MRNDILKIATDKIDDLIGINCKIIEKEINRKDNFIDAKISLEHNNEKINYFVEIMKKILPEQIPRILQQIQDVQPVILMADYISPKAREMLRLKNIPYADTAGNMYLSSLSIYIYVQTDRTNRQKLKTKTRAFNKAGLKVLFQILINPEYLNKPYRFIGEKARVTIATVGNVIQDLLREKYIVQTNNKKYQFVDRPRLFEEWVRAYNNALRPKLNQKRYKWLEKNVNWRNIELPKDTYWGSANAAEIATEYIIADQALIYTGLPFQEVMKDLKIIPDEDGEIKLIEKFWKNEEEANNVINPMLIYADLLYDPNPRHIEAANKIYKQYVQDKL